MSTAKGKMLKGGRRPAVKAGDMRITQSKGTKDDRSSKSKALTSLPKSMLVSTVLFEHFEYSFEAVRYYHEKPLPTHDVRTDHISRPRMIQQPRK